MSSPCLRFDSIRDLLAEVDDSRRHSVPISAKEIESIMHHLTSHVDTNDCRSGGWVTISEYERVTFMKAKDAATGVMKTRLKLQIPQIPPQVLFYCVKDPLVRASFDSHYRRFEVSRIHDDDLDVVISELKAPVGIANREFVEWRRHHLPAFPQQKDSVVYGIALRSCEDTECSAEVGPALKHKVQRAETWLSGYVFRWWLDENNAILGSEVIVHTHVDPRGKIPKALVNSAAVLNPTKWVSGLTSVATSICNEKNISVGMTDQEIESVLSIRSWNYLVPLLTLSGSSSELTATSERELTDDRAESPKDSIKYFAESATDIETGPVDLEEAKDEVALADPVAETVPEGWRYLLHSSTVSMAGISMLAFFLTLSIWNTWRAVTYILSPMPEKIMLRCALNLSFCVFAVLLIFVGTKWLPRLARGMKVLGNVMAGIGLWELIESLVTHSTGSHVGDLIVYAVALCLCSITVFLLFRWRGINIIDSSLLSPV